MAEKRMTLNLDFVIWLTSPGVASHFSTIGRAIRSWIIDQAVAVAELAILIRMLQVEARNHRLYKEFFQARTDYYTRRYRVSKNKKPPTEAGGEETAELILSETDSEVAEQTPDYPG